ncbi:MAG: ABC transporter permease, partial [Candidatus Moraniibacteriota bacterium]
MRFFDILKLSLRMFKARTMRTLLTVLGMSVGIAAIMFLVSFGYGLQRTLLEKITTSDALVSLDVTSGKEEVVSLNQATIEKIKNIPNVVDIIPALEASGQGKFGSITLDVSTVSTAPSFLKSEGLKIEEGRLFDPGTRRDVVITAGIAKVFNATPEEMLGRTISMTFFQGETATNRGKSVDLGEPFTIVGVAQGEDNIVYIPLDSLGSFPIESYTKLKVKC